ncbi:MAG: hypothetical protein ACU84J_08115 [Gammaproteobacteria bacterium]
METGILSNNSTLAGTTASIQRNSREERVETIDSQAEERTENRNSNARTNDAGAALSDSGLRLSTNFVRASSAASDTGIDNNEQARRAIENIRSATINDPARALTAQGNPGADLVQSLLS